MWSAASTRWVLSSPWHSPSGHKRGWSAGRDSQGREVAGSNRRGGIRLTNKKSPAKPGFPDTPKGSRTPVFWLRTRHPRPLDDRGVGLLALHLGTGIILSAGRFVKCPESSLSGYRSTRAGSRCRLLLLGRCRRGI